MMMVHLIATVCLLVLPVGGEVVAQYAPGDGYSGHWGIDIAAPVGSAVAAPVTGEVTFAGSVAGMRSVTIRFGSDMRVSVSYLASVVVKKGDQVGVGEVIGWSGLAHGIPAVHLSVRRGASYVNPAPFFSCRDGVIRLLAGG